MLTGPPIEGWYGSTLQAEPFQCNRSVFMPVNPPTAQASRRVIAATPYNSFNSWPGLGLGTILQAAPSQWIVRVCSNCCGRWTSKLPTAQISCADAALTALRMFEYEPAFGLTTCVQAVPSQWRIR